MTTSSRQASVSRQGVLSNYLSLGMSSVLGSLLALWATSHLARALGVEVFGSFNVARAVVEYGLIPASFGVTVVASRSIASGVEDPARFAGVVVALRLFLSVCGLVVALGALLFVDAPATRSILLFMAPTIPLIASHTDWLFSAYENQRWPGLVRVFGRGLYALLVVGFVRAPGDAPIAATALVAEAAAATVLYGWKSKSWWIIDRGSMRWLLLWRHLQQSARLGVATLAQRLKTNADLLMLGLFAGAVQVGYYSAAYRLVLFVNSLSALYATVLMPRIARARSEEHHEPYVLASSRLALAVSVAVGVGGAVLGGQAVVVLMGEAYEPASAVVAVLLVASGFIVLSSALGYTAIALGHERHYSRALASTAIMNIAANLVLIPRYGMFGAAGTTMLTEVVLAVAIAARLWGEGLEAALRPWWLVRLALCASAVGAGAWLPLHAGASLWTGMVSGALAWVVSVACLGVLPLRELKMLV